MTFEQLIDTFQNNQNAEIRRQAADDLVANKMYNDISIQAFANGLMDSDTGIVDICQRALLNTPDEYKTITARDVVPFINSKEIELRNLAGEILTKMGKYAVPTLLPYLKSSDFDVRKFACDILGLIGDATIVPHIIPLLNDSDKNTMLSAIETLGNLNAESALDPLIMVYENFDEVKPFVIESIGKIGGKNSESYLLEQLETDKSDIFLQTTIIDALSYNAKSIDISYKLLERMPNCKIELQKIMMMTAFAIAFRLEKQLIMPDELRYVSHIGMKEKDENIMIASLIALGNEYRNDDTEPLMNVVSKNIPDLNKQILYNLVVNSSVNEIHNFLEQYFTWDVHTESNCDFLVYLPTFWNAIPAPNKDAVIDAILLRIEQYYDARTLEIIELIYNMDSQLVKSKCEKYAEETSQENKELIENFLMNLLK
jgi:hypothetical protein